MEGKGVEDCIGKILSSQSSPEVRAPGGMQARGSRACKESQELGSRGRSRELHGKAGQGGQHRWSRFPQEPSQELCPSTAQPSVSLISCSLPTLASRYPWTQAHSRVHVRVHNQVSLSEVHNPCLLALEAMSTLPDPDSHAKKQMCSSMQIYQRPRGGGGGSVLCVCTRPSPTVILISPLENRFPYMTLCKVTGIHKPNININLTCPQAGPNAREALPC